MLYKYEFIKAKSEVENNWITLIITAEWWKWLRILYKD